MAGQVNDPTMSAQPQGQTESQDDLAREWASRNQDAVSAPSSPSVAPVAAHVPTVTVQPESQDALAQEWAARNPEQSSETGDYRSRAEGLLHEGAATVGDVAIGAAKGAGQTIQSAADLAHKVLPAPVSSALGVDAWRTPEMQQRLEATNTAQKVGVGIEGIAEFFLGDEVLKSLTLAERLGLASKLTKIAETNPRVERLIGAGITALRTGTVSGAQSAAHGGDFWTGAAWGAGGELVSKAAFEGYLAALPKSTQEIERKVSESMSQQSNQRRIFALGVEDAAAKASTEATGVESVARDFDEAAKEIKGHFNTTYDALRALSGGEYDSQLNRWSANGFDDAVTKIKDAKNVIYSRNPASTDALTAARQQLAEGEAQLEKLFGKSEAYAAAKDGWKKALTLEDLHNTIDKSFTQPAEIRRMDYAQSPEVPGSFIDPKKFVARANRAVDGIGVEKLQHAMGTEAFNDFDSLRREVTGMVNNENYAKTERSLIQKFTREAGLPRKSPMETAGTAFLSLLGGAGIGAGVGAVNAAIKGEDKTAGAVAGATTGAMAGAVTMPAVVATHWLYTHPNQAVHFLKMVSDYAQVGMQAGKQMTAPSHVYDPETGTVRAVTAQDIPSPAHGAIQ